MQVLNYYKTLNNNKNKSDKDMRLSIENIDESRCKEYKGFYMVGNYIVKNNVIITEVVKPSKGWIDNFLNKGVNLSEGKLHFNYDRPLQALEHGKKLLKLNKWG